MVVCILKSQLCTYRGEYGEHITEGLTFSSSNTDSDNYAGGHAISIMGWGIQPRIRVGNGPNDIADVPYWYCRTVGVQMGYEWWLF